MQFFEMRLAEQGIAQEHSQRDFSGWEGGDIFLPVRINSVYFFIAKFH